MIRCCFTIILFAVSLVASAQKPECVKNLCDTVHLKEIKISAKISLENKDIVDFYRTNHFSTLDDINARLDGMMMIKRGAYALEPQLNGFSGGQLNVTIDGMKMFGACTDKMDPVTSYIEPSNLKSISITHGTNGCQNGCSNGGTIDMTLQEPNRKSTNPLYYSLGLGYESISTGRNVLFSSGYSKNKWAWGMDGVYRKNENYRDGRNRVIQFSQFEKTNIHSVLKYTPDNINSFKADVLYDFAENVGYPALPMDVRLARAELFALEYQREKKSQLKIKMYYNDVLHIMDDSKRDSAFLLFNHVTNEYNVVYMRMDMPGKSRTFGTYAQDMIPMNKNNILTIKADNYTNYSIAEMTMYMNNPETGPEPPMYMQTWPAMLRNVTGIFIKNSTFFSDKLMVFFNGRIDNNLDVLQSKYGKQQFSVFNYTLDKTNNIITKSVNTAVQYFHSKIMSMVVTTGYAERVPTISERLGFYLYNAYDGYDYIGNPYLKSEKSEFFGVVFKYSKTKLKINLNQVFTHTNDYILGLTDSLIPILNFYSKGIRRYVNINHSDIYSADLQILYCPYKYLSAFMLSKYTFGNMNSGDPLPLIAPFNNTIAVQFQGKQFSVTAENQTSLKQKRININYGETVSPSFSLYNIKGSYQIIINKYTMDFSLGITNILNKTYYEHLDIGHIYRPGRSLQVYLKISY